MPKPFSTSLYLVSILSSSLVSQAEVSLPNIFGDHMVFQREQTNPVWGWAEAGEEVTVSINGQSHSTTADENGDWQVDLEALPVGGPYTLTVEGENSLTIEDVLSGEVWLCSGQSNMVWPVSRSNHADVEIVSANFPEIRLISIPNVGTQEPQENFKGEWAVCSPESVPNFSAVGYFFGRRIHNTLGVPVGLIDNAWGGSAAEAWVPREVLAESDTFTEYLDNWDQKIENFSEEAHAEKLAEFKAWKAAGSPEPRMRYPRDIRVGNARPGNLYNGVLNPVIGYGIRGAIWYQGESNAGRSAEYQELFPLMISTWRDSWDQGDFPFYWVQLADFKEEQDSPAPGGWAYVREAQTMTLSLPNTGEAVIIDAGEGRDIHPRDKQTVADRLVRHALANEYGFDLQAASPRYESMEVSGNEVILTFSEVDEGLYAFETKEVIGFAIAGEDGEYVYADAEIVGKNQVKVFAEEVEVPVAVRYAWASNPVANLYDRNGLPVTPFRTDSGE
tara:strand:+ start:1073 stop:2581 length:1509 start_codon:yes stop_codon:yes gene_type:complete